MRLFLHILFLTIFTLASVITRSQNPYDIPMACVGTIEDYRVQGLAESDFEWRVIGPDGTEVDPNYYFILGQGETIQMTWSETLPGGIYTFEVIEHSAFGCTGEPYIEHIMLNSPIINIPFDGVPEGVAVCIGDEAALDPGSFLSYLWQDEETNRVYYTGEAGTYQVRLINSQYSCTYNEMELTLNPLPVVWLGNDTVLFGAQNLLLDVYDPNINIYNWSTGAIGSSIVVEGGYGDQFVWVTVTDMNGCSNSDSIFITGADYRKLRIPSAFTPNGDGINDTWIFPAPLEGGGDLFPYLDDVDVKVFNRWGKLVWQSEGMFREWDGRDLGGRILPMDSYHYIIKMNVDGKTFTYRGSVTIVR